MNLISTSGCVWKFDFHWKKSINQSIKKSTIYQNIWKYGEKLTSETHGHFKWIQWRKIIPENMKIIIHFHWKKGWKISFFLCVTNDDDNEFKHQGLLMNILEKKTNLIDFQKKKKVKDKIQTEKKTHLISMLKSLSLFFFFFHSGIL